MVYNQKLYMKEIIGNFTQNILNSSYPMVGLIITAFAESSFFPIPPDVIYIPLALLNSNKAFLYALITTLFSVLGGMFGYLIGKYGGKPFIKKIISEEKLYQVKLFYNKYDTWAIIIAGFTPIPYKVFTISAGLFDLNFSRFIIASFLGRGGRFFLVCSLIYLFGQPIKNFLDKYFELLTILITFLIIGGLAFLKKFLQKKKN